MQGKGVVRFFLIALTLVCLYQFSLTIPTNGIESDARRYADNCSKEPNSTNWRSCYAAYLDSMSSETVFSIPYIKKFTYADLKKSQLAMGLDLKGGMSVLLQVDLRDFLKSLAQGNSDPAFIQALDKATELQKSQQGDYISLFAQAWRETGGGKPLASIFARNESLKSQINFNSPDADVIRTIRTLANSTVDETYKRLKQRIDKLGVVQPNVSLDAGRDLIQVELPGIDNPERARNMLQRSAKLEFWDTYRMTDDNMNQRFIDADMRLRALISGDTVQTQMRKDTAYVFPNGADGNPDTTKPKEMRITDVPAAQDPQQATSGPLLSALQLGSNSTGPVLGYADKNKTKKILEHLNRPEIKPLFPADLEFHWSFKPDEDKGETPSGTAGKYKLFGIKKVGSQDEAPLDGSVVNDASAQPDPKGEISVSLSMNNEGARIWADMTTKAVNNGNREIAIVLDGEVVSAPYVINPITGGNSSISGGFTIDEAKDLANILQVGKLPAGTHIVQESQVGPSLGADNINKSLFTMLLSVGLLCAFMIAYYNRGGIISVIALLANIFFIIGTLASMGTVLTLPGIAGIVLTLAAAVDANVIIYERIREELRNGLSMAKAVSTGFNRALSAIIDANVTTLLTAVVLIYFGLGPIKGFGTVLTVGIISSLFTAVLVGRMMTEWWMDRGKEMSYSFPWTEHWLVGINYDWIGKRKIAYAFSIAIMVIGAISFFMRGFELGVDFKGGYSYNIQFDKPVEIEQLRGPLTQAFEGSNPVIKAVNTENTYNITTSYLINDQGKDVNDRVVSKLREGLNSAGITTDSTFKNTDASGTHIASSSQVGPTVADDIRDSSIKAGLVGLLFIFLYLLVRFHRWQFSMGAVLALFHDVLITLTFFTLLHGIVPWSLEIDQAIIACILTVIGYSVNDTVIVYDRIREFMNTITGKKKEEVFIMAINTTLSRTLITSGTVVLVVLLLFLFGGGAIKGFAFGMLVGIVFGTYSSVFVASALVVDLLKEDIVAGKVVEAPAPDTDAKAKPSKRATAK
ncbi:MAG: protein translocase subunit SecDF [Lewinellaceae bacterium]|nr:protein translocase subunit SecDF [Lewinellaceae bacterium]